MSEIGNDRFVGDELRPTVEQTIEAASSARPNTAERWSTSLVQRETEHSPEDAFIRNERDGTVHAALSELSETDRTAVMLAAYGYRGPEVARSLRRTESAARTLLCRARSKLRARLATADIAF